MARQMTTTTESDDTAERVTANQGQGDDRGVRKFEDIIWFIVGIIAVIIIVRFVLLLFGARTGVPFVDFWYGLSAPLIAPFAGMFGNIDTYNVYTGMRVELESPVALIIYSLLGYLVVLGIRLLRHEPKAQ